jgi:uncharacterized membrane-anchored protein YitT (DUF2179 family)
MSEQTIERYKDEVWKTLGAIGGAFLYAAGINLFVVPAGLYSGGLVGVSQVIRTVLTTYLHMNFGNVDIAGIIYYLMNVPIFIIAFKKMGKGFVLKTFIIVTAESAFLALIPTVSILNGDVLTECIVGAIISGFGIGLTLRMGGSGGGMDVIGVMLVKWRKDFSVGKVNLAVNVVLYAVCLFLFDIPIVIYSLINAAVYTIAMDKTHYQNIDVSVSVITKHNCKEMEQEIFDQLGRGITKWKGSGAYTEEETEILYIMLSKYEVNHLKEIIHQFDPDAFLVVNEGVHIDGNYLKKL